MKKIQIFSSVGSNDIENENTQVNVCEKKVDDPELPDRVLNPECYDKMAGSTTIGLSDALCHLS